MHPLFHLRPHLVSLAILVALPVPAHADTPTLQTLIGDPVNFKLSGSVRVRHETLDGQPRAGFRAEDEQLALRTTLAAEYRADEFRVGAELYDSRAYLDRTGSAISANEVNTFELVQAYVGAEFRNEVREHGLSYRCAQNVFRLGFSAT